MSSLSAFWDLPTSQLVPEHREMMTIASIALFQSSLGCPVRLLPLSFHCFMSHNAFWISQVQEHGPAPPRP